MKTRSWLWPVLFVTVSVMGLFSAAAQLAPPGAAGFRNDRILVKPKAGVPLAELANVHAATGSRVLRNFPAIGDLMSIELAAAANPPAVIAVYQQSGLVEYAEPDFIVQVALTPNDFRYFDGTLWGLNNTGQLGGTPDADIDAPEGWNIQNTASNIVVAVIDSGVRLTHEDLAANLWTNPGESGKDLLGLDKSANGIDDDGDGYVDDIHGINAILGTGIPLDDFGHGSHVSGIIGAVGNNTVGVVGVAWRVQLMECKFLDSTGHGSISDAITCIDYARSKNAKIINASWGGYTFSSTALRDAINSARNAGIIFVAATGNDDNNNDVNPLFPASYDLDNIMAVAATDRMDGKAWFSNFGATTVDLGAPGAAIFSCWNGSDSDYRYLDGTSMATPHVVGVCALVWEHNPSLTYNQVITRVLSSTDALPALAGKCVTGGRLNLQRALGSAGVVADFTANPTEGAVPLTVNFTDSSSGTVIGRTWNFGDGSPTSTAQNPTHVYANDGKFTVTLTVTGAGGATSSKSQVVTAVANYQIQPGTFSWVDPSAMTAIALADDGVSAAQVLPFPITFYGQSYNQIYVGANGLVGFVNQGLSTAANTGLPNANPPNAALYPYWADLDPSQGGSVRLGVVGSAPNRRAVVSWVDVPVKSTSLAPTRYSFQVVLYESSNRILFQYLNIEPNRLLGERQTGTVGIENATGAVAAHYSYNENPTVLSNGQALEFVLASAGKISVTPTAGLSSSGAVGGPFSPGSQSYVVANNGSGSLNWSASGDQSWITLSATSGQLAAGQQATVTVMVNSQANLLSAGSYVANVSFMNLDNGDGNTRRQVNLTVNPAGDGFLAVMPGSNFSSYGPRGGPFSPDRTVYMLTNTGNGAFNWVATKNRDWVSLSSSNGTLVSGGSAAVTVAINTNANKLAAGSYSATINFVNSTTGQGNTTRKINLKVQKPGAMSATSTGDGAALSVGQFRLRFSGQPGDRYVIQATSDLVNWVSLRTNTVSSDGFGDFYDPDARRLPRRFYRALLYSTGAPPIIAGGALGNGDYRGDRILVKPKGGIALATLNLQLGARVLETFPAMGNLQVLGLPAGAEAANYVATYRQSGLVEYAELDYLVQALREPNDFRYTDGSLWGLNNVGQLGGTLDADIDGPEGWDSQNTASNIVAAVIDTGVRYTHEDLAANMWVNPGEIANNGLDDDGDGFVDDVHGINTVLNSGDANDDHGHGTHVSGTIGAQGDNSVGVVGVCWKVQIMALKFLDSQGNGSVSDTIKCIDYARTHGAKIINASWGTPAFNSAALRDAIASVRDADIIFVAAAGNSAQDNGVNPVYPASFDVDNIISVAATTRNDELATFSNFGATTVHLGAPGTPIFSCWNGSDSDYQYDDGTSMAAAHVSGVCALVRALYPNETYKQIINRVLGGTDPLPSLAGKCTTGGRLNLQKALGSAPPPPTPTVTVVATDATASESEDTGTFTLSRSGDTSAGLTVNYTLDGTAGNGSDYQTQPTSVTIVAGAASTNITVSPVDDTAAEGDETVIITLVAGPGYRVGSPSSATITIHDNDQGSPPPLATVSVVATDATASEWGDPGTFTISRSGSTTAALTVNYTLGGTAGNGSDYQTPSTSVTIGAGASTGTVTVTPIDDTAVEGSETVVLTLTTDAAYTVGSPNSATITIADNDSTPPPPPAADLTANPTSGQAPLTVQFTDRSSGSITTWDWNFGDGSPHSAVQNPSHTYSSAGDFSATLTVTGGGGSDSNRLVIHVTAPPPPPPPPTVMVVAADATASEPGTDTGTFTISRTGNIESPLTVRFTLGGTAVNGIDYQALPNAATLPAGSNSVDVIVRPVDDTLIEVAELVILTLTSDPAYDIGLLNTATVVILDDDLLGGGLAVLDTVTVTATDANASESGDAGMFTFSRTGNTLSPLTVNYTLGGTASNGTDYQSLPTSVTIAAGASSADIMVQPIDDAAVEGDETVILMLSPDILYTVGSSNRATITIADDDPPPPDNATLDAGTTHYPDLQTLPPSDLRIQTDPTTGQKLLRFSNTIANEGHGRLEVVPVNNSNAGTTDAYQRLYSHDLTGHWYVVATNYAGTFFFHPQHDHWHFEDFSRYELREVAPDGLIGSTVLASNSKVSFCLEDSIFVDPNLGHASSAPQYTYCDQVNPQGISVGWADVYQWDLYGQSLDITHLPDGDYWVVSTVDPDNLLDEGGGAAETNNTASVRVHISGDTVTVLH